MNHYSNKKKNISFSIISAVFFIVLSSIMFLNNDYKTFTTPDENSNFFFLKIYSEEGRLFYSDNLTANDPYNINHIRGVLSWNGKGVPYNFLGLPFFYSPFFIYLGNFLFVISIFLSLIGIYFLYRILNLLIKIKFYIYFLLILLITPWVYWTNHYYMNIIPALSFLFIGLYYFIYFINKSENVNGLILATIFFAICIFFRYEYLLFLLLLFLISLIFYKKLRSIKCFVIIILFLLISLIIPLLFLNNTIYDSPFTYGYSIFTSSFYPERLSFDSTIVNELSRVFLPEKINYSILITNLKNYFISLFPLFFLLFLTGVLLFIFRVRFDIKYLFFSLLMLYIMVYAGSGLTWGFDQDPTVRASITRYWLLPLLSTIPLIYLTIKHYNISFNKKLLIFVYFCLFLISINNLLIDDISSLSNTLDILNTYSSKGEEIAKLVGEESIIFTDHWDKYLINQNITLATWWFEDSYNASEVSSEIYKRYNEKYNVYLISQQKYVSIAELNDLLNDNGLILVEVNKSLNLFNLKNETYP